MKGVLLLGGSGSRLHPLNKVCNKHLINVGGKPMAQWNIEKLVNIGITEILIITGKEHISSIISYLGSGKDFGCNFTYKVQEEAGGIAQALKLVDGFVDDDEKFITILGDNIFEDDLKELVDIFTSPDYVKSMVITTTEVEDPERFGVINLNTNKIIEKPERFISNSIIAGIYGYTNDSVFRFIIDSLEKSDRGEIEVTDLNNDLLETYNITKCLVYRLQGYWTDAGTHESLKLANEYKYG